MMSDQAAKGSLHVLEVAVDVGVIEFDAGKNNVARAVVEKLRSLVKKAVSYSSPSMTT